MRQPLNPYYTARHLAGRPAFAPARPRHRRYALLPLAPVNASPVPELTSLYHNADPGRYGNRSYPGNCGGNLIRDLLLYFRPKSVLDPMTGSGTCRDVCGVHNCGTPGPTRRADHPNRSTVLDTPEPTAFGDQTATARPGPPDSDAAIHVGLGGVESSPKFTVHITKSERFGCVPMQAYDLKFRLGV